MKHGLYSEYFRSLSEALEKDDERLIDIREQILLQHGLLVDLLERAQGGDGIDPDALLRISQTIVISIEKHNRIELARERRLRSRDEAVADEEINREIEKVIGELAELRAEKVIELAGEYIEDPEKAEEYRAKAMELLNSKYQNR